MASLPIEFLATYHYIVAMKWRPSPYVYRLGLIFILYVAICKLSLLAQTATGMRTQIWPAAGLAMAGMLIWGPSIWPAIFFGTLTVHLANGDSIFTFLGPAIGNFVEPLVGFLFCSRRSDFEKSLSYSRDVVRFIMGAAFFGSLAGALVGVSWIEYSAFHKLDIPYFIQYWAGDYLGILMLAPLILVFSTPNRIARFSWKSIIPSELIGFALLSMITVISFMEIKGPARLYFFFPLILWAALRLGQRGVTVTTIALTAFAIWQTALGVGPFVNESQQIESEFYLVIFVATLQLTGLVFASIVMEREVERITREDSMERARLNLQLVNMELEEAIQARDEFLSIASHELKTPITPLKLQLQMMRRLTEKISLNGRSGEIFLKNLANCERCLDRLCRLTDELVSASRIRIGQLIVNTEEVDLSQLVRNLAEQYQPELGKFNCSLDLRLEQSVIGHWDRVKVEEVVVNLLTNAIKFGAGFPIEIQAVTENDFAIFTIRDHGPGIALKDQERIFQRFERAVSSRHYGGLGLGLYITRQIVEAHGGTIAVESTPADGSRFIIRIPLRSKGAPSISEDSGYIPRAS